MRTQPSGKNGANKSRPNTPKEPWLLAYLIVKGSKHEKKLSKYKDAAWNNAFLDIFQACGQRCCSLPSVALMSYLSTPVGILCAVTDENQTFETDLCCRLRYLFVIVSGLFFNRGSHSTATTIPINIRLHNIFSQWRPVRNFAIMLSTTSVGATVKSKISLLSMIFEMALP